MRWLASLYLFSLEMSHYKVTHVNRLFKPSHKANQIFEQLSLFEFGWNKINLLYVWNWNFYLTFSQKCMCPEVYFWGYRYTSLMMPAWLRECLKQSYLTYRKEACAGWHVQNGLRFPRPEDFPTSSLDMERKIASSSVQKGILVLTVVSSNPRGLLAYHW